MDQHEHLDTLKDIRNIMERSWRFISLSGLAGVFAGIYAIAGLIIAYYFLGINPSQDYLQKIYRDGSYIDENLNFLIMDAGFMLIASLITAWYLSFRKARKEGQNLLDATAVRMVINLVVPLLAGGIFCLILVENHQISLVASCMLIFYGLALINASKYTFDEIRYLGYCELTLGLFAAYFTHFGLLFWAAGFGILHIIYGALLYNKHDRLNTSR